MEEPRPPLRHRGWLRDPDIVAEDARGEPGHGEAAIGGGIRIRVRIVGLVVGVGVRAGAGGGRDEAVEGLVEALFFFFVVVVVVVSAEANRSGHRSRGCGAGIFISSGAKEMKMPPSLHGIESKVPIFPPTHLPSSAPRFRVAGEFSRKRQKKKSSGRRREKEEERGKTGRVTETDQTKHDVGIRVAAETRSDDGRERERGREWGGTKPYASLSLSLSLCGAGMDTGLRLKYAYIDGVRKSRGRFAFPFLFPLLLHLSLFLALQPNGKNGFPLGGL